MQGWSTPTPIPLDESDGGVLATSIVGSEVDLAEYLVQGYGFANRWGAVDYLSFSMTIVIILYGIVRIMRRLQRMSA